MRINVFITTTMTTFGTRLSAIFQDNRVSWHQNVAILLLLTVMQIDRQEDYYNIPRAAVCRLRRIIKVLGRFVPDILFIRQSSQVSSAVDLTERQRQGRNELVIG